MYEAKLEYLQSTTSVLFTYLIRSAAYDIPFDFVSDFFS